MKPITEFCSMHELLRGVGSRREICSDPVVDRGLHSFAYADTAGRCLLCPCLYIGRIGEGACDVFMTDVILSRYSAERRSWDDLYLGIDGIGSKACNPSTGRRFLRAMEVSRAWCQRNSHHDLLDLGHPGPLLGNESNFYSLDRTQQPVRPPLLQDSEISIKRPPYNFLAILSKPRNYAPFRPSFISSVRDTSCGNFPSQQIIDMPLMDRQCESQQRSYGQSHTYAPRLLLPFLTFGIRANAPSVLLLPKSYSSFLQQKWLG